VMMNGPALAHGLALLAQRRGLLGRVGLHLNLTEGAPRSGTGPTLGRSPRPPPPGPSDGASGASGSGGGSGGAAVVPAAAWEANTPGPVVFRGKEGFSAACIAGLVYPADVVREATAQVQAPLTLVQTRQVVARALSFKPLKSSRAHFRSDPSSRRALSFRPSSRRAPPFGGSHRASCAPPFVFPGAGIHGGLRAAAFPR
jgi:hypothetical protein